MKTYKIEVWVTAICFILVAVTGGFLSAIFVIANPLFFNEVYSEAAQRNIFLVKSYVMGFPLHYLLLILFSWLGATLLGAIWCLIMDKVEEKQRA